jgi:5-methylcytosine-specific restriction protein B
MWSSLQSHTIQNSETVGVKHRQSPYIFNKKDASNWEILVDEVKEQIPELYDIIDSVENFNPSSDKEIQRYVFTTFHQSYSYEDFIEGIKPIMIDGEEDGNVAYHIEDGVFKQLCKKAEIDPENRYAIFIDEINRGNVSAIFGELITLIEQDKRKGATNAMSVVLPYSKKHFSVPQNVDVYGTMNTADRSVEALDTALRRRFSFEEMLPQPELIASKGKADKGMIGTINLVELLSTINERIEALVDRDHTIGHAFFMEVDSPDSLRNVFANKVIPLLQEYFYGDYAKMEMVIGPDFFNGEKRKKKVIFAIQNEDIEIPTGNYELMNILDPTFNFDSALNRLLNRKVIEVEAN